MKVLFYRCSKEEVDVILLIMVNFVNWFKIYLVKYYLYFFFFMYRCKWWVNWGNEYSKFYLVIFNKLFILLSIDIVNLLV